MSAQPFELDPRVVAVARDVRAEGGCAMLVGGYVRDRLLNQESKDVDLEILGLPLPRVRALLSRHGEVIEVGRAFGVLRLKGLDVDFSLPRADSQRGSEAIAVLADPSLDFEAASRRRDLSINAIGLDPLTGEYVDPHGGIEDLRARRLRATDAAYFADDPLRVLRVAQISARFEMSVSPSLLALCRGIALVDVAPERIFHEFRKLLLRSPRPSIGLKFLLESSHLRYFPALQALVDVPQDPQWHPEGDVWVHTLMVVDEAAKLRHGDADDLVLMFAALCHDLGKPATTEVSDRIRSNAHDVAGIEPTRALLDGMRAPHALVESVCVLVRHHLAPALLVGGNAGPRAYRKLARSLRAGGTSLQMLARVARADHLGRTTPDALAGVFPAGDTFLDLAQRAQVVSAPRRDVVMGRHLIARGFQPGRKMGELLERCREVEDDTGWDDPDRILDAVLGDAPGADDER